MHSHLHQGLTSCPQPFTLSSTNSRTQMSGLVNTVVIDSDEENSDIVSQPQVAPSTADSLSVHGGESQQSNTNTKGWIWAHAEITVDNFVRCTFQEGKDIRGRQFKYDASCNHGSFKKHLRSHGITKNMSSESNQTGQQASIKHFALRNAKTGKQVR